ncbi:GNAT family N-acetyltransferase [uncultured Tateyamaria sp.]|uniref:GNAT family N-acetyltransferase n=1 Tax=uncultured Tateyamaria sp. TaxID=455651 RepID=UPI002608BE58|nr:GNAT family N-acetyltransferase [uncultured Tateyamaria sp.]
MITLTGTPILRTERLTLRAPIEADADAFVAYFATQRSEFTGGPKTRRDAWNFFGTELGHWVMRGFGMFTVTRRGDDTPLGIVGHWYPLGWAEREIGWVLFDPKDEGQGIAAEAATACVAHAFGPLGWDTAVSYIAPGNVASIRLAERLGAQRDDAAPKPETTNPCLIYRHPRPAP